MNTVERYIRRVCEEAKGRVIAEALAERQSLPSREIPIKELPQRLQDALRRNIEAAKVTRATERTIDKLGFDAPYGSGGSFSNIRMPKKLSRDYRAQERITSKIDKRRAERIAIIENARTTTTVGCMGLDPKSAKRQLQDLQAYLAKV